jgi:hypothetical protein
MSNSKLVGKIFDIPHRVLKAININLTKFSDQKDSKGYKRAIFLLKNKRCTYEQLKRIKNYFDSVDKENFDEIEYLLNGGDELKNWVEDTLTQSRQDVNRGNSIRSSAGLKNQFRSKRKDSNKPKSVNIIDTPDLMKTSEIINEIFKIREIIKQIN